MPLEDQPGISSTFAESAKLSQEKRITLLREDKDRSSLLQNKSHLDQNVRQKLDELRQSRPARIQKETNARITKLNLDHKIGGPGPPMNNADYNRIKSDVTRSVRVSDARAIKQLRKEGRDQIEIPLREAERKQAERQARAQAILDRMRDNTRPHTRDHKRT
jgi:hypothetical protein